MKTVAVFAAFLIAGATLVSSGPAIPVPDSVIRDAFADRKGVFVLVDCATGRTSDSGLVSEKLAPCSTFKIWNTLVALDLGLISSPQEAFYKWDGEVRSMPQWNKDLTVREAFQASCVPAFQALARKIGPERMQNALDRIGYGDRDISSGIDVFWLPAKDRKTVLITPEEQARLMCRLVTGKLPFSQTSLTTLKEIMFIKRTPQGVLYGKTGSRGNGEFYTTGWFVGFVESQTGTFAFACNIQGKNLMGKNAQEITETILEKQGLL